MKEEVKRTLRFSFAEILMDVGMHLCVCAERTLEKNGLRYPRTLTPSFLPPDNRVMDARIEKF